MKNRAISFILLITLVFCLSACGKKDNDLSKYMPQKIEQESPIKPRKENAKGSRSKPYSLNEKITFSSVDMGLENMYTTTATISKLESSELENAKKVYKNYWGYECGEIYSLSFEIKCNKGDNSSPLSDRTDSGGCFLKNALDENMSETYFNFFDKKTGKAIYDLYPDTKYDLYMTTDEVMECKYITFEYHIDKYETETLWIEVK